MYVTDEVLFDLPSAAEDQSVNIFSIACGKNDKKLNIVITRDSITNNKSLDEYVGACVQQLSSGLLSFNLIGRRQVELDGTQAVVVEFQWMADSGMMYQRQIFSGRQQRVLVFTATTLSHFSHECEEAWKQVANSIRWRR